jgi:hypothetical protein
MRGIAMMAMCVPMKCVWVIYVNIPIIPAPVMMGSGVRKMKYVVEESVGEEQRETVQHLKMTVTMGCVLRP